MTRLRVLLMLVLAVTSSSLIIWHFSQAIPAPSVNTTCEPGGCASGGPYTFSVYTDSSGPSYLAQKMKGGGNSYKETEPNTLFSDMQADSACSSGCSIYVNSGTYTMTTNILITISGISIVGAGMNSTIFDSSGYDVAGSSKGTFTIGKASVTLINIYMCCLEIKNHYLITNTNLGIVNNNPVRNVIVEKIHSLNGYNGGIGFNSQNVAGASRDITVRDCLSEQEGLAVQFYDIWYGRMLDNKDVGSRDDAYAALATVANGERDVLIIGNTGDWSGTVRSPVVASLVKIDGSNIIGALSEIVAQSNWGFNPQTGISIPNNGVANYTLAFNNIVGGALSNRGITTTIGANGTIIGNNIKGMATADITLDNGSGNIINLQIVNNYLLSISPANGNIWFTSSPGKNVIIRGNIGYNPKGLITNPFQNTGSLLVPQAGASATPTSGTIYRVTGTDNLLTCSGGTVTAIVEKDLGGNQVFSVANCAALPATGVMIPIGWSITFTDSVAPSVSVFGY